MESQQWSFYPSNTEREVVASEFYFPFPNILVFVLTT